MKTEQEKRARSEDVQTLWLKYAESHDKQLRDRLVLTLAPMVKFIVYRKMRELPARCEIEDFISCGLEALMWSIDRYDPTKGATLEQFAWRRIHGAVLDEMRRRDWAPRSLRRWEREISRSRERFIAQEGRAPTRDELAGLLNISVEELDRHQDDISRSDVGSLNVLVLGEDETTIERIDTVATDDEDADPEDSVVREHAKERFRAAFATLPERDRQVAVLLYVHNLTLREIGEALGVTESRVCQIHAQLRRRLHAQLSAEHDLFAQYA